MAKTPAGKTATTKATKSAARGKRTAAKSAPADDSAAASADAKPPAPKKAAPARAPRKPASAGAKAKAKRSASKPASDRSTPAKRSTPNAATKSAAKRPAPKARSRTSAKPPAERREQPAGNALGASPAAVAGAAAGAFALLGGLYALWRGMRAEELPHRLVEREGEFEIRAYSPTLTVQASARGPRREATDRAERMIVDYLESLARAGRKVAALTPVMADGSDTDGWRVRLPLPANVARGSLPEPPSGVALENEPSRRVAAIRLPRGADDSTLAAKEGALRSWLQLRSMPSEGKAVLSGYGSRAFPDALRRRELLIPISER